MMARESTIASTVGIAVPPITSSPAKQTWPPEQGSWTYEDWLRLPDDGFRYEVLNGELHMTPPPTLGHQSVVTELARRMGNFIKKRKLGRLWVSPIGVRLPGQPVPVQPDIVFVRSERSDILGEGYVEGAPDLVVEVLSPTNWLYDRREKLQAYQQAGVPEYWIVDYRARTVEILALEEGKYTLLAEFHSGEAARSQILPGFEIGVDDLFET
jgi:Uma2 family endonuclease